MASAMHWKETPSEYRERLKVYDEKTKQNEKLHELLHNVLPSAVDAIKIDLNKQNVFNILSVGSGDGEMDIEIVKIIRENFDQTRRRQGITGPIRFVNRAMEPDRDCLSIYKRLAELLAEELSDVTFELGPPRTFSDYEAEENSDVKFDVVHFIHSLYNIEIEKALTYSYNTALRDHGMIVLSLNSPNHVMNSLKRSHNIPGLYPNDEKNSIISSIIEKSSWKSKEFIEEHEFDVSDIFDEKSKEGEALLDFLRMKVNFRANSDPDEVQDYLELIRKHSVCREGKYYATFAQRIVIIFK